MDTISISGSPLGYSYPDGLNWGSWIADTALNDTLAHEIANDLTGGQEISGDLTNLEPSACILAEISRQPAQKLLVATLQSKDR